MTSEVRLMGTKFRFWAYGILAVAAFALFLYATTSIGGYPEVGVPLLDIAVFIIGSFIFYMFVKLLLDARARGAI